MAFSPPKFFRHPHNSNDDSPDLEYSRGAEGNSNSSTNLKDSVLNPSTRVSMMRVVAAWGFGAAFMNMTSGAIYTSFARAIGANDFAFGVLAGALPLMSFLQILAARLIEGSGRRKRQMMIAGIVGRSLWVVAAMLPLFAPHLWSGFSRPQVLAGVMACVLLSGAFQAFNTPAFFSWMSDLVPSRVRPSFFARRMQIGTVVALSIAVVAGMIADYSPTLQTYSILLACAGICGILDIVFFIGVREPQSQASARREEGLEHKAAPILEMIRAPLQDVPTRRFLLFVSLLMASYGFQGPFLWLHALEYLNLSKTMTGVLLNSVPLVAMAISLRFWGDVLKRYGNRPVMRFCSMGIALASCGWLIARPGAWDVLPILLFVAGSFAGAMDLANQNLITGLSPHIPRSSMAAAFSIAAGLSFAAAAWIGGALAESFKWIGDGTYFLFGLPLVNYHILFLISLALRLFNATFVAPRLHEPEATGMVETVKEVFPELAQSFAARFTKPIGARED